MDNVQYCWYIFNEKGRMQSGPSSVLKFPSNTDTEEYMKKAIIESCWRKGYTGILIGCNSTGIVYSWKYTKE